MKHQLLLLGSLLTLGCLSAPDADPRRPTPYAQQSSGIQLGGRFPITAGGRFLYANGAPFLYLADTAWMLPAAASDTEASKYLQTRAAQGFTVVQMYLTPWGLSNWGGVCNPNDSVYWAHVENVVAMARQNGLVVAIDPAEAASLGAGYGAQAYCLGERASRQLAGYDNIVWFVGGDGSPASVGMNNTRAMVAGIRAHDAQHLISYHGSLDSTSLGGDATSAYSPLFGESWMGYSMSYDPNYFLGARQNYVMTRGLATHGLPVVLGESEYEGSFSGRVVRQPHYWSLLSGGVGGAFGNEATMNMSSNGSWMASLNSPGARHMGHLRTFAVNYPWFKYIPTPSVITGGGGTYGQGDYVTAATADDKSFLVAYLPVAGPITIDPTSLGASKVTATWFDPATGASTPVAGSPFSGTQSISLPAPPSSDGDMAVAIVPVGNAPPPSSKGAALPGILRVAQYDEGGEGVAYHDRDTTNLMSSTYRPGEGVDSDGSSVGWIYAGEWLAYTVSVSTSGTYDFAVPMSHPGPGGILHFDVDGANASGVVNIPNSGDWDTYATVHVAVPLTGGEHLLKVIFDTNGSTGAGPGLRDIVVTAQLPPNSQPGCPFAGALRGPNGLVVDGNGVILAQPSASVASEVWSLSGGALRSQGSCLGMGATYDGAALQRLPCASVATQQWSFQSDGTVRSSDNRCVSVAYANPSAGRQLVIWPCVGHVTQTSWSLCP